MFAPDDPRKNLIAILTYFKMFVPWEGSVCTFHMVSLKPHDWYIMEDLSAYDRSKYQLDLCKTRPAPGSLKSQNCQFFHLVKFSARRNAENQYRGWFLKVNNVLRVSVVWGGFFFSFQVGYFKETVQGSPTDIKTFFLDR